MLWKLKHPSEETNKGLTQRMLIQLNLYGTQPVKLNLNEKLDPKQKTIQAFNIDA